MVSFKQARDMFKLQRDAKKVRKELKQIHVEAEGRLCKVTVTAEQEIVEIKIFDASDPDALAADLMDALNRALKKAQVVSAERMQGLMGEMGLPTAA